jgi:hypothetical protein
MNSLFAIKPMLTEPGVTYFINETLKQCHSIKESYQNTIINVWLFLLFIIVLAILLVYKYKGKLTQQELKEKDMQKKQYILSKIRNFQDAKIRSQQELITGLPHWETEYDIVHDTTLKKLSRI